MTKADPEAIREHMEKVVPLSRARPREVDEDEFDMSSEEGPEPEASSPEEIPAHLLDVPGLVGHITRWITKSALYPQPMLSLGAALAVVGTAGGRKYAGPTKSGTHLYVLGLAQTGGGKNHPAKQAKRLMRAANMDDMLGPGQFQSEPAVYQYVSAQPQMLCFMDEFGSYLKRINNPKGASGYEKAISGALRQFWGASWDIVQPPAWAASRDREKMKPIESPSLSIYGMSVHDEFYAALQSEDIANGFLNRFLVLSTQQKPEEVEPQLPDDEVPAQLVDWLQRIAVTAPLRPASAASWKAEVRLDWETSEARLTYATFRKGLEQRPEDAKLLSRTAEMAVRLATIRAIGRIKPSAIVAPTVSLEDIGWGCELALWSANRMIGDTAAYMIESEHQGRALEVLRYLKAAKGRRMTLTDLSKRVRHKYPSRVLRDVLEGLQDAGDIEMVRVVPKGPGRPTDHVIYRGE